MNIHPPSQHLLPGMISLIVHITAAVLAYEILHYYSQKKDLRLIQLEHIRIAPMSDKNNDDTKDSTASLTTNSTIGPGGYPDGNGLISSSGNGEPTWPSLSLPTLPNNSSTISIPDLKNSEPKDQSPKLPALTPPHKLENLLQKPNDISQDTATTKSIPTLKIPDVTPINTLSLSNQLPSSNANNLSSPIPTLPVVELPKPFLTNETKTNTEDQILPPLYIPDLSIPTPELHANSQLKSTLPASSSLENNAEGIHISLNLEPLVVSREFIFKNKTLPEIMQWIENNQISLAILNSNGDIARSFKHLNSKPEPYTIRKFHYYLWLIHDPDLSELLSKKLSDYGHLSKIDSEQYALLFPESIEEKLYQAEQQWFDQRQTNTYNTSTSFKLKYIFFFNGLSEDIRIEETNGVLNS